MNQKKSKYIEKNLLKNLSENDRKAYLDLQDKVAAEQGMMLMLLSSVMFLIGFAFTLIGQTQFDRVALPVPPPPTALEQDVRSMVGGYPIERMVSEISKQDRVVAAFVVAIAKKESNWGKRSPKLDGKDCFNYWGFREQRDRMGTGGHTCFDSPRDAVRSVSERIGNLVYEYERDTPREMVVWKCGYSCDGHSAASVDKWVSDVDYYFRKLKTEQIVQRL